MNENSGKIKSQVTESKIKIPSNDLELRMQAKIDELHLINAHFKTILGNMSQGILFIQESGMVSTYNPAAEILIGIDEKKVLWQSVFKNFPDDFFGFSLKEILHREEAPPPKMVSFRSFLGIDRIMEVSASYVTDPKENKGLLILVRDITEFHRLQVETSRFDRLKTLGEVSAHLIHSLRNPLTGIRGFALLLQESKSLGEKNRYLGNIIEGIDALNEILSRILDFSRPVAALKRQIELVKFLNDIILQCIAIRPNRVHVEFISSCLECYLAIDPLLIKQAIWNLIQNSMDAMPNGGSLTLSLSTKDNEVVIGIADSGVGISKEELDLIFQPFFTTKPKGNGFGMTEVQKILDAHQGKIEISSTIGSGTYIRLIFWR